MRRKRPAASHLTHTSKEPAGLAANLLWLVGSSCSAEGIKGLSNATLARQWVARTVLPCSTKQPGLRFDPIAIRQM